VTQTIFIYVPGIRTRPGEAYNWSGRAVTWTNLNTPHKAEKVEYFTLAITRPFGQADRAHKLQRTLRFYSGWNIHLVGHSNGCDVIIDALRSLHQDGSGGLRLASLHLISAACDNDFRRNGLNVWADRIDRIVVYIARRDRAMVLAGTVIGSLLGYGTLGRTGPVNVKKNHPVEMVYRNFGHSDWFATDRFDAMMDALTDEVPMVGTLPA